MLSNKMGSVGPETQFFTSTKIVHPICLLLSFFPARHRILLCVDLFPLVDDAPSVTSCSKCNVLSVVQIDSARTVKRKRNFIKSVFGTATATTGVTLVLKNREKKLHKSMLF